jgi:sugar/nucleoside kinase (ribokinase family)
MRLVSVGNIIVDIVVRVPALPERGGDVVGVAEGTAPGGSFNTLVAASRQGLPSVYAGAHGTGPYGNLVRAALVAEGIGALNDPTPGLDTGFDVAMVDDDGERTFVTSFGAEAQLSSTPTVSVGDFVHASGYGLLETTNGAVLTPWLGSVPDGVTVLLDPGPLAADIPSLDTVRARADWLSCNAREAQLLTGEPDAASAARALAKVWRAVVVRLGPEGCLVDGALVPGFPSKAVDTNGAGDAHVGAFLAALAAGLSPIDAARRANACAAIAVTRRGPASAPTAAEVDAFVNRPL